MCFQCGRAISVVCVCVCVSLVFELLLNSVKIEGIECGILASRVVICLLFGFTGDFSFPRLWMIDGHPKATRFSEAWFRMKEKWMKGIYLLGGRMGGGVSLLNNLMYMRQQVCHLVEFDDVKEFTVVSIR
ncbi:hypothetical protein RJT34_04133 [Clitoria ternatea]|uniref:Uncharacterized protein n=1 Tax=Clitoria ternatea TaxID=43366 RepID=A0AAN9Q2C6_CLITE